MATYGEWKEEQKKKKKKNGTVTSSSNNGGTVKTYGEWKTGESDIAPVRRDTVQPIKGVSATVQTPNRTWFQKSKGNTFQTILGSSTDVTKNASTGILGMGEKILDALAYLGPGANLVQQARVGRIINQKDWDSYHVLMKYSEEFIKKDLYDEEKVAKKIISDPVKKHTGVDSETMSVFGAKSDSLAQSAGQLGATMLLQAGSVPWWVTTGVTSFGAEAETALNQGATMEEAGLSAAITAGTEILSEKLSGGISFGGKTLDDALTKELSRTISNKLARTLVKIGVDAAGEGFEEIFAGYASALGQKLTYMEDKEISEIFSTEDALESFIGGAFLGGVSSAGRAPINAIKGIDHTSNLTNSEDAVVRKVYESAIAEQESNERKLTSKEKTKIYNDTLNALEKGYIDIDTIESTLGKDTYNKIKSITEQETKLKEEYDTLNKMKLGEMTGEQTDRKAELKQQLEELKNKDEKAKLKEQLSSEMKGLVQGSRLSESYSERTRRGQAFEADLTKYTSKEQKVIIQKAIDSKILNNTNRTHEFVDMISKISADKGVLFDFTDNAKLKESGFAIDGKTVNGYVQGNNVSLNIQSSKSLNKVVGHEITHVLEGTELYSELQKVVREYATTKGEYGTRLEALQELYKEVDGANIENELTADLIGDYLFTDEKFINNLSTKKPNIFVKIYDEIKYLVKVATVGSKEAKELEKVKRVFEKAYKQSLSTENSVRYSFDMAEDEVLYQFIEDSLNGNLYYAAKHTVNKTIPERLADDIESIVGFSVKGYGNVISPGNIEHINKEHGTNGRSDQSLVDMHDLAKVGFVVEYYDKIRPGKVSYGYKNRDGSPSMTVELQKKIDDGFYYVVEAVPDAKSRELHVISVYKNQNDTFLEVAVSNDPSRYVQDEPQSNVSFNNIIPELQQNTTSFSLSEDTQQDSDDDIRYGKNSLSEDSEGRTLSNEQKEYFKDSKVTDDNGKLKVMYHGSPASFTQFDKKKAKSSGYYGSGFYFTESESHAGQYGSKYKVYLNIKNPMQEGTSDITKEQIRKFVEAVAENEDYGIENYGYDASVESITNSVHGKDDLAMLMDINVTCIGDMVEAIQLFNEVNGTDYDGIIVPTETIAFYPEQIKNVDNIKPTTSADIRYSLGEQIAPIGNYNVYGSDIALNTPEEIAPIGSDIAPTETEEEQVAPVVDKFAELKNSNVKKIKRIEANIKGYEVSRDLSVKEYDDSIARKQAEYDSLKRTDTKRATKLLEQIESIKVKKQNAQEYFKTKIDGQRQAIENIKNSETAYKRKSKQQQYEELFRDLMGDTSTWVDKKMGISYQTQTLRRNLRDTIRDAKGNRDLARADAIYDEIQGKYNHNQALLNKEATRIKQEFRDMKLTKAEDVYVQMLGESRSNPDTTITQEMVDEFYNKNKNKIDTEKVDRAIDSARKLYDSLYDRVNGVLREQGFKEIEYRQGYFPHFTEPKQGLLAKALNWKMRDDSIPTSIAGITEMFNPERSRQSFDKHRTGDETDYSFSKGLDNYVNGALDWIYHIEDIQKRRAFENEIRYQHSPEGVKAEVEKIKNNPFLDADQVQEQIDLIYAKAKTPLNNFVTDLRNSTNNLAGKKSTADRTLEYDTDRQIYTTMTNISNRVSANAVVANISSALTNFIPITQSWGQVSPLSSLEAMGQTIKSIAHDDGVIEKSDFLTNRLAQQKNLYQSGWDKAIDKAAILMNGIDFFTAQTVWRSKYNENIRTMSEADAIKNADQFAENVMAGRSRGNMPTIFNSKNPITKVFTAFQLEVANQYGYMFKDMPQDIGKEATAKLVQGYVTMFAGAYVYNALTSTLTGRNSAFDPIRIIQELLGDLDDDDEETDALGNLASNVAQELPFVGGLLGGGRIPISSAIPYDDPISMVTETYNEATKLAEDGNWKDLSNWKTLLDEWSNPFYYAVLPAGGGQLRKTVQGLSMFDDEHPVSGSYTQSGDLRFPVEDTFLNKLQAGVFGQYASENSREYFDRGESPLKEKQIQEYQDLGLPIRDYWEYRDGLAKQDTLEDKFEYVSSLDVTDEQKNIMINNVVDRKEKVDISNYDDFANYEEFDFYSKNTEKYEFLQANGISYSEYTSDEKARENYDNIYTWYKNNPEKVTVSKAITDNVIEYRQYTKDLDAIRADKDSNGNSISGTSKAKKTEYINNLDLDYGQKIILYRSLYDSKTDKATYNPEIVEYLNSRDDISYEEMVTILEELDMKVLPDGSVTW